MKVQQYNPAGNVSTNAVQFRRLNEVDTGVAELGQSIQGAGQQALNVAIQEREEVNMDVAEEARVRYESAWLETLHGEGGYLSQSGKNAYDGKETVLQTMEGKRKEILKDLNPEQARLFGEVVDRIDLGNRRTVYRHAEDGRKAHSMGIQQSSIENAVESGALNYRDPKLVAQNLAVLRDSTITLGEMEGVDASVLEERLQTATSKYYSAVVGRAIEQDPVAGEQLLDKYGKYMEVADLDQAKANLEGYKRDQQSMDLANTWMTANLTITDARAQAEKIQDPDLRKQAMDEFKVRKAEKEAETDKGRLDLFNRYSSEIENPDSDVTYFQIPRKERDFMTHGQRQALKALEQQRISGKGVQEMPFDLRMELDDLIGKNQLDKAKNLLSENYHRMTKQDRKEYSNAVNKGVDDPEVYRMFSYKDTVKQYIKDFNDDEKAQFIAVAEKWRQNYIRTHDKEPTPEEERKHLNWLLINEDGWDYGERYKEPDLINKKVLEEHVETLNGIRFNKGLPPLNIQQIQELDGRLRDGGYYID